MGSKAFYLVTGMSGAGKSTALNSLEDAGFYCVDNLPVDLLDKFLELMLSAPDRRNKVALAIDIRSGSSFQSVFESLKVCEEKGQSVRILFLDCEDHVLVRRYKETRRKHPLAFQGNLADAILQERSMLSPLLEEPGKVMILDTTELKSKDLARLIAEITQTDHTSDKFRLNCSSFGYKNGIPRDADLVFDVRFLQNPFYIPHLREKRGTDSEVAEFVFSSPMARDFLERILDLLGFLIPLYMQEGRHELNVAFGCTGGHHRSVAIVEKVLESFAIPGEELQLVRYHRDYHR